MTKITALVLTYNERENIGRALDKLRWVSRVLILDSYSCDETLEIARTFPNVEVVQRVFDSFADQCNYALSLIETEWVLSLDADYLLSDELVIEIQQLVTADSVSGYSARFRYCVHGVPLRSTLYPPRTVLYRRGPATYEDEGHGHRVRLTGRVESLRGLIDHDDRKPLSRWVSSQVHYSKIEARHLLDTPKVELKAQDRLRLAVFFAPAVMFVYLLIVRGLILDDWRGWYYVCQRTIAEMLLSLRLLIEKHGLEGEGSHRRGKGS